MCWRCIICMSFSGQSNLSIEISHTQPHLALNRYLLEPVPLHLYEAQISRAHAVMRDRCEHSSCLSGKESWQEDGKQECGIVCMPVCSQRIPANFLISSPHLLASVCNLDLISALNSQFSCDAVDRDLLVLRSAMTVPASPTVCCLKQGIY